MTVYHTKSRTRASTWVPRRVFYVLRFLQRQLTAGKPQALSNKQIQQGTRFGSEGEVSQIMRWLSGELPTMGRWAYGCLNTNPQQYRFLTRERMPHGGYLITLLGTPEPIADPAPQLPTVVQLSFFENDPSVIPQRAHQDAAQGGSFFHDPLDRADPPQPNAAHTRSQGDQHEETQEIQTQEEESARSPLFERLLAQPGMSRSLARRIADRPLGSLAEFESDLALAHTFARSPFFFTIARWRDGQRVVAPEEPRHEPSARDSTAARKPRTKTYQPSRSAFDQTPADYDALLAEIAACNPGMSV